MDDYLIECQSAEFDALARVICELFPEQTRFTESSDERGRFLSVQWLAMRFGSTPKRMTLDIRIVPAALARYLALRPMQRAQPRGAACVHGSDARFARGTPCGGRGDRAQRGTRTRRRLRVKVDAAGVPARSRCAASGVTRYASR
jgi:hypothetical protein